MFTSVFMYLQSVHVLIQRFLYFPVKLRRVPDKEYPLLTSLEWDPDKLSYIRLVLQENETGEIMVGIIYKIIMKFMLII